MTYKTILVQLDLDCSAASRLIFAWNLASRFKANLIAFAAVRPFPVAPTDFQGLGAADAIRKCVEETERQLQTIEREVQTITQCSNRASWRGLIGDPTNLLTLHARAADLLVLGTPDADARFGGRYRTVDSGNVIVTAGRPVLFAPIGHALLKAERILIAWKDTREARRSVVDAMPFLVDAEEVTVAMVDENDVTATSESIADVVRFLLAHGVKARGETLARGSSEVADTLTKIAGDMRADLIVSGGYGHSRLHEWTFGGVTRALLKQTSFSRLMSN